MKTLALTISILIGAAMNGISQEQPDMHKVGAELPAFELKDLDGKTWSLEELKGQVVLVDFWYMACPPCQMSNPKVKKLHKKYSDDGLVVLAINSVDNNDKYRPKLKEYKGKEGVEYTILLAETEDIKRLKAPAYPSFYIIGKDGKIKYAQGGFHPYVYKEMKGVIKDEL